MSGKRYSAKFKKESVKQTTEGGYAVSDVARRLETTTHSLYAWLKKYGEGNGQVQKDQQQAAIKLLKAELKRVTEERNIRLMHVHPSGYYVWRHCLKSKRQRVDDKNP